MDDERQRYEQQARQVVHEYACALKAGNKHLAGDIRTANPDLTDRFDKVDGGFRQVAEQRSAD